MHTVAELIRTGCELYTGFSRWPAGNSWPGFAHNWNLLLVTEGTGQMLLGGQPVALPRHSLTLLAPGRARTFQTSCGWGCHWVHFDMNGWLRHPAKWPELCPGIRQLLLADARERWRCRQLFLQLAGLADARQPEWYPLASGLIQELILRGNMLAAAVGDRSAELWRQRVLEGLESGLTNDELAARCGQSRSVFYVRFRTEFGQSPREYREELSLTRVRQLLQETRWSLAQIARELNWGSAFYLSRRFKLHYGISPQEFRRNPVMPAEMAEVWITSTRSRPR